MNKKQKNILIIFGVIVIGILLIWNQINLSTVCCKITVVYPGAEPTYSWQTRSYCSLIQDGKPIIGASRVIVGDSYCEEQEKPTNLTLILSILIILALISSVIYLNKKQKKRNKIIFWIIGVIIALVLLNYFGIIDLSQIFVVGEPVGTPAGFGGPSSVGVVG